MLPKFLEDAADGIIESNEIPYIVPRIVVGGAFSIAVALTLQTATQPLSKLIPSSVILIAAALLAAWLIGYCFDTLSLLLLRIAIQYENSDFGFFYKSASGYRLLLISSIGMACVAYLVIAAFVYFVGPKFDVARAFGFEFFLSIFLSTLILLVALTYALLVLKRAVTDLQKFRETRLNGIENIVETRVGQVTVNYEKQVHNLEEKIKALQSSPDQGRDKYRLRLEEREKEFQDFEISTRDAIIKSMASYGELLEKSNSYLSETIAQKDRILQLQEQLIARSVTSNALSTD